MTRPTTPTIHLNGTSAEQLLQQQLDAMTALRSAYTALQQAAPNARDYYVQSNEAFPAAVREHLARLNRINETITELETIAEHVGDQQEQRQARRTQP